MQSTAPLTTNTYQAGSYTDFSDLAQLRLEAKRTPDEAMKKVAKQFESLFINMMLKSMRQASFGDPIFDSNQSDLYRDMFDNQIALNMSEGNGIGLAEALMLQLGRYGKKSTNAETIETVSAKPLSMEKSVAEKAQPALTVASQQKHTGVDVEINNKTALMSLENDNPFNGPESFVQQMWPHARKAARELGVQPAVLIAQAALETGWGKAVSHSKDGVSSHNLFNIKADSRWHGDSIGKTTLEYHDGVAQKENARFRAYNSFAESFDDYVRFVKGNPRYQAALNAVNNPERYIEELHQAGYATDPAYANKVKDIMRRDYFNSMPTHVAFEGKG